MGIHCNIDTIQRGYSYNIVSSHVETGAYVVTIHIITAKLEILYVKNK